MKVDLLRYAKRKEMKMKTLTLVLLVLLVVMLVGCAASPNKMKNTPNPDGDIAGFWRGLWHGMIAFIMFFVSLFSDNYGIYEVHNNGGWYNFGFLLGVSAMAGGSASSRR